MEDAAFSLVTISVKPASFMEDSTSKGSTQVHEISTGLNTKRHRGKANAQLTGVGVR